MRRIYVMDCNGFVKIGVSINAEQRRKQIPYRVNQYYCTEPIKNPFKVEKFIHNLLRKERIKDAKGIEYFGVSFSDACKILNISLNCTDDEKKYLEWIFETEGSIKEKIDLVDFIKYLIALKSEDLLVLKLYAQTFKTSNLLKHKQ